MLGIETRRCHSDAVCLVAGADAGYRFADDNFYGGITMVPRVRLDLGGRHLRVRPSTSPGAGLAVMLPPTMRVSL